MLLVSFYQFHLVNANYKKMTFFKKIDYYFRKMKTIQTGAWERFLPRGGPSNTKNEIFPILKIFTL